ncbi:2-C-methyl-D-erythritol 4-phosphate cytidylyltransferase [Ehrlichia sp. JZT12]
MHKFVLLIVAAGNSNRLKESSIPKQYITLGDYPILYHTINNMITHSKISHVKVVIKPEHQDLYNSCIQRIQNYKLLPPTYGGARRQDSVRLGLESIKEINPNFIIIHDACRPFINLKMLDKMETILNHYAGVIPVLPITDTIHMIHQNNTIIKNIDRNIIKLVQTPQAYKYNDILLYHRTAYNTEPNKEFSDESSLMINYNIPIMTVEGDYNNFKITTIEDLFRAISYIKNKNQTILKNSEL